MGPEYVTTQAGADPQHLEVIAGTLIAGTPPRGTQHREAPSTAR